MSTLEAASNEIGYKAVVPVGEYTHDDIFSTGRVIVLRRTKNNRLDIVGGRRKQLPSGEWESHIQTIGRELTEETGQKPILDPEPHEICKQIIIPRDQVLKVERFTYLAAASGRPALVNLAEHYELLAPTMSQLLNERYLAEFDESTAEMFKQYYEQICSLYGAFVVRHSEII